MYYKYLKSTQYLSSCNYLFQDSVESVSLIRVNVNYCFKYLESTENSRQLNRNCCEQYRFIVSKTYRELLTALLEYLCDSFSSLLL